MAANNFILDLYRKLWTLIDAHAPTAGKLKAGNEIRQDRGKRNPDPKRDLAKLDGSDFPRVYLRAKGMTGTAYGEDQTFVTMAGDYDPATCGGDEAIAQTFEIKIVHAAVALDVNALFELELLTAIRKGGPKLGFEQVAGWSYASDRQETRDGEAGGVLREATTITVTVRLIFNSSELVT